jgi:hypothetical protein
MARQLGTDEGEAFDRRLREVERAERLDRLSRMATAIEAGDADGDLAADPAAYQPSLGTLDLQRQLERLSAYYHAVESSRAWRLTQRLRRLVGRAW